MPKREAANLVTEGILSRRTRRISPTRQGRRKMKPGRKLVQRPVKPKPRRSITRSGIGVSIIRRGAFILPRSVK
jgi:hypothetical protein